MFFFSSLVFIPILIITLVVSKPTTESYYEQLSLKPTHDGKVVTNCEFTTLLHDASPTHPDSISTSNEEDVHYRLFPLSLGQILRIHGVTEMKLSLNSGKWDYSNWGMPNDDGIEVASGGMLWIWMAGDEQRQSLFCV